MSDPQDLAVLMAAIVPDSEATQLVIPRVAGQIAELKTQRRILGKENQRYGR